MKYYAEYKIIKGVWQIYDLSTKSKCGIAECAAEYDEELFDKMLGELVEKSNKANNGLAQGL